MEVKTTQVPVPTSAKFIRIVTLIIALFLLLWLPSDLWGLFYNSPPTSWSFIFWNLGIVILEFLVFWGLIKFNKRGLQISFWSNLILILFDLSLLLFALNGLISVIVFHQGGGWVALVLFAGLIVTFVSLVGFVFHSFSALKSWQYLKTLV